MKKVTKFLATFLAAVQIMQISTPALALEAEPPNEKINESSQYSYSQEDSFDTSDIIHEVVEKRTENTKHFNVGNGKYIATQYDLPVHYQDDNGDWQQYDNSMEEADSNAHASEEDLSLIHI